MNKFILEGNLVGDSKHVEIRLRVDKLVFTVATNENYTDRNGAPQVKTEFNDVALYGLNLVKIMEPMLKKGARVLVEGKLSSYMTETQGVKYKKTEVAFR